jgi:hypothetical protein
VRLTRAGEVLEVGGEADKWARSAASGREREREEGQLSRLTLVGRAAEAGLHSCLRASLRRGQRPDWPVGRGKRAGRREPFWAEGRVGPRARRERREGEKRGEGFGKFFFKPFQIHFSNF